MSHASTRLVPSLIATVAAIAGAAALASPPSAQAAYDIEIVTENSFYDTTSPKRVEAHCPKDSQRISKRVIGVGGAASFEAGTGPRLTRMEPQHFQPNGYRVVVEAETPRNLPTTTPWRATAIAVCASGLSNNYTIVNNPGTFSGADFKHTEKGCPSGTVTYGAGAKVNYLNGISTGRVGLQLMRTSNPLDISRATAREDAGGNAPPWSVTSYAICARKVGILHTQGEIDDETQLESTCPADQLVHGGGGGGHSHIDGGPVWLQAVLPRTHSLHIRLTGILPLNTGGLYVLPTCGYEVD